MMSSMATSPDVLARRLADELERRAAQRTTLGPEARNRLFHEFRTRLEASDDAERLAERWQNNLDHYINRALPPGISPQHITGDMVSRQFEVCSEICPGPEKPQLRTR